MHEVERLCSRVSIIHKGRVQAEGDPRELLERYHQTNLEDLFFHLVENAKGSGLEAPPKPALSWDE
jgi:ABC-type Na+ transport system ATPase subunit NatA